MKDFSLIVFVIGMVFSVCWLFWLDYLQAKEALEKQCKAAEIYEQIAKLKLELEKAKGGK